MLEEGLDPQARGPSEGTPGELEASLVILRVRKCLWMDLISRLMLLGPETRQLRGHTDGRSSQGVTESVPSLTC